MVVLTGGELAEGVRERIPALALQRARELSGGGCVLVLEEGDDVERDLPQAGRYGLLTHLDDPLQEPFAFVRFVREGARRVFEAQLATDPGCLVVVPEEPWVDERLLLVLSVEGVEVPPGGSPSGANLPPKRSGFSSSGPEGDRKVPCATNKLLSDSGARR